MICIQGLLICKNTNYESHLWPRKPKLYKVVEFPFETYYLDNMAENDTFEGNLENNYSFHSKIKYFA